MKDNEQIAREATEAALASLDSNVPGVNRSMGHLGDSLAYQIHNAIVEALERHQEG